MCKQRSRNHETTKAPSPFSVSEYSANPGPTAWLAVFTLRKERSHVLTLPLYSPGNSNCILSNLAIINVMQTPDSISDWYLPWKCESLLKKGGKESCKFPTLRWYSEFQTHSMFVDAQRLCAPGLGMNKPAQVTSLSFHQGSGCRSTVFRKHRPGFEDSLHLFYYPFVWGQASYLFKL